MQMAKNIVWSHSAKKDFSDILAYLNENWGVKIAHKFSQFTFAVTLKISNHSNYSLSSLKIILENVF